MSNSFTFMCSLVSVEFSLPPTTIHNIRSNSLANWPHFITRPNRLVAGGCFLVVGVCPTWNQKQYMLNTTAQTERTNEKTNASISIDEDLLQQDPFRLREYNSDLRVMAHCLVMPNEHARYGCEYDEEFRQRRNEENEKWKNQHKSRIVHLYTFVYEN